MMIIGMGIFCFLLGNLSGILLSSIWHTSDEEDYEGNKILKVK